jgi:integrase
MEKKMKKVRSLNELLTEKMLIMRQEGRASHRNYRTLLRYIETRCGIVKMSDVDSAFAANLHRMMRSDNKSAATIKTYFAILQSVTNYGAYLGCVKGDAKLTRSKSYELDKVKLEKPKKRQGSYFTKDDIKKLWEYWKSVGETPKGIKRWLGLFFASYLCNGANMADLARLRYDKEWMNSKGRLLGFYRHKVVNSSGIYVRVPVTENLKMVIDAIGDEYQFNGLVFGSFLNDVDVNDNEAMELRIMYINTYASKVLRKICKQLGIRDDCSFTFARHSYCTILNSEGVNYAVIERNLGHTLGITDNYLGDIPTEKLFECNSHLL